MGYPKIKPCPKCQNDEMAMYGYGDLIVQPDVWKLMGA